MRSSASIVNSFSHRFHPEASTAWIRKKLERPVIQALGSNAPTAMLLRELQMNLDMLYTPTVEGVRIAQWIYEIASGFCTHRYQCAKEYVDICYADPTSLQELNNVKYASFDPDAVPICAVDGLPGVGKSALVRALTGLFPAGIIEVDGNPPQRIATRAMLQASVQSNFSVLSWAKDMRDSLFRAGIPIKKTGHATLSSISKHLYKALYRTGVSILVVDELQFASGKFSAKRALDQILSMRSFGVPIVFFSNTDFLSRILEAPAQVAQRIPRDKRTLFPILRETTEFNDLLSSQLRLVPLGHEIDVDCLGCDIYDLVGGSPRGTARLIEIGAQLSLKDRRALTYQDLIAAERSPAFDAIRKQVSTLRSIVPVNKAKHPELATSNRLEDPASTFRSQVQDNAVANAAAVALYTSYMPSEREQADAAAVAVLRNSGLISPNVTSLGESRKRRASRKVTDDDVGHSYAAKRLAAFVPMNPTLKDGLDQEPRTKELPPPDH